MAADTFHSVRISHKRRVGIMDAVVARYGSYARRTYESAMNDGYADAPHAALRSYGTDLVWDVIRTLYGQAWAERLERTRHCSRTIKGMLEDAVADNRQLCQCLDTDERYPFVEGYRYGDSANAKAVGWIAWGMNAKELRR